MNQLPAEVLDAILQPCDFQSLKHLRLTCKRLNDAAAPCVFRRVHMGLFKEGVNRLERIAAHPTLSGYVKNLSFHGELLPKYRSQVQWEAFIDLRGPFQSFLNARLKEWEARLGHEPQDDQYEEVRIQANKDYEQLPKHTKTPSELEHHFYLYQSYRREQEDWDDLQEGARFRAAICKLVKLKEAKMVQSNADANQQPVWRSLLPKILQGPADWRTFRFHGGSSLVEDTDWYDFQGVRHLALLLEALVLRGVVHPKDPVTTLVAFTKGDAFWTESFRAPGEVCTLLPLPQQNANSLSNTLRNAISTVISGIEPGTYAVSNATLAMLPAFINLTRLHVKVWFSEADDTDSIVYGWAAFLREARAVEDLDLEFQEENYRGFASDEILVNLLPKIRDVTWPKLRVLSLMLMTSQSDLIDLLKRHASTLRELRLIDSTLKKLDGQWEDIIRQIPEFLKLDTIWMESLMDDTIEVGHEALFERFEAGGAYEEAVQQYLLHGGEFPILDRDEFYRTRFSDWSRSGEGNGGARSGDQQEDEGNENTAEENNNRATGTGENSGSS